MKKYIVIFLVIILINTVLGYFVFLGLANFDKLNYKLLLKAAIFAILVSSVIFYVLYKNRK